MANNVNNYLRVETISAEGQKVWDSFIERIEDLQINGNGHLTGLFYEADDEGYWIVPEGVHASEAVGAKWAFSQDHSDDFMNIESAWSPVLALAEHIAQEIGKVDPEVRLVMTYEDEMPNFVGVATFTAKGMNVDNDIDHDDLQEYIFSQHPEIHEMWDYDECDWKEGKEDEGFDAMSDVQWDIISEWQYDNMDWDVV